jgi:hypothetical protein
MADSSNSYEQAILEFCKTREELCAEKRKTKDERSEHLDAEKTLNGLLIESMEKNNITCICMGDEVGEKKYLRVMPPTKRSIKIKCVDDILELTKDMSRHVDTIPKPELAAAVVSIFKKRALERGQVGSSRLVLAQRGSRGNITERTMLSKETLNLSCQYIDAKTELIDGRNRLKRFKNRQADAERKLIPLLPSEGALVKVSGGEGRKERTIRLHATTPGASRIPSRTTSGGSPTVPSEVPPEIPPEIPPEVPPEVTSNDSFKVSPEAPATSSSASTPPFPKLGMRTAISIVREAASEASEVRHTPDMDFDKALKVCILVFIVDSEQ